MEYELLDTGVFDGDRYFDVFVEYAKAAPEDILVRITVHNRGPEAAPPACAADAVVPQHLVVGRADDRQAGAACGAGRASSKPATTSSGPTACYCEGEPDLLFTENESNAERLWEQPSASPYVKDAFHRYVVAGRRDAVNPARVGTKGRGHYVLDVPGGGHRTIRLRLSPADLSASFKDFDQAFAERLGDADEFYTRITPPDAERGPAARPSPGAGRHAVEQAVLLLRSGAVAHRAQEPSAARIDVGPGVRNTSWFHMLNADIISMPDKWEYPWYAAWDLAFHTVALALVDFDFAKDQLLLMLRALYFHPNGQIPAYEWNFSDVNPPVHAWATLYLFKMERTLGRADMRFLERSFQSLMLNFNWWVNRKDPVGRNVFAGGFLGLDNIGVFDRSAELPTGGSLEQADGTAWMAFYCQCMLEMALILAEYDPIYEEDAFKFVQHFIYISYATDRIGEHHDEMWDEEDGFFYDVLRTPDGRAMRLKVRSLVGLLPLCASTVFPPAISERFPRLTEMIALFRKRHPELVSQVAPTEDGFVGHKGPAAPVDPQQEEAGAGAGVHARRRRIPGAARDSFAVALSRGASVHVLGRVARSSRCNTCRPSRTTACSAATRTGAVRSGCRSTRSSSGRCSTSMPSTATSSRSSARPGRAGSMTLFEVAQEIARRLAARSCAATTASAGVRRDGEVPERSALARSDSVLRVLPRRQRRRASGASHQTGWTGLIAVFLDLFGRLRCEGAARKRAGAGALPHHDRAGRGRPRAKA